MDLPFGPLAADAARGAVAVALKANKLSGLVDDAQLASSEAATNAVQHGSPPLILAVEWAAEPRGTATVEITVTDGGCRRAPRPARAALPEADAEHGRGLWIMQALSAAWSLDIGAATTRAWCRLSGSARTPDAEAARRGD
ncbi:ATP-binding protein [Streptomyces sp. B1866]|uniref:ATP-binding protein n=1 Tax=Streptomyces sp. B1866 TaxID=3075431 RepID=UPI00288F223A|nr:ATP-binding protein [Streptomyces sp. B1866]MDT3395793.1 ATP-binding protein [Streptomyces sp. B1866]